MPREYRTPALVLRTFDQGESDRIVHLYTRDLGRVAAIAKGARRSKRRFPGILEIFSILDARIVDPPRSSLMRLEGARLLRPLPGLTDDLARYAIACLLVELLDRLTGEGEAHAGLFEFCVGVLDVASRDTPDRLFAVLVLAKILARLGYRPELNVCVECGASLAESRGPVGFAARLGGGVCAACRAPEDPGLPFAVLAALDQGIRTPLLDRAELGLTPDGIRALDALIWRFFQFHIGLEPRAAGFLRSVLDARPAAS